jgi:hypothetical protein
MSFWADVLLDKCLLGKCLSGQMSFWANVLLGKFLLVKCLSGQMSYWANVFWTNVLWANVHLGKCLSGQMSSKQMSSGQMSFWAKVSGQMSLGKCRMGKCRVTLLTAPGILVIWVVTHPSTNRAQCCLTSVIKRVPVCPTWQNAVLSLFLFQPQQTDLRFYSNN